MARGSGAAEVEISLLGGFEARADGWLTRLAPQAELLLAYLALEKRARSRATLAGVIWPMAPQDCAQHSLRSTLWRLNRQLPNVVLSVGERLTLAPVVRVDATIAEDRARRLIMGREMAAESDLTVAGLCGELLPEWDHDWLVSTRERIRQLVLHGLDALSEILVERRRYAEAIEAALEAIRMDPLRESGHRRLIAAHLAEGNRSEAVRAYQEYARMLWRELQIQPSDDLLDIRPGIAS